MRKIINGFVQVNRHSPVFIWSLILSFVFPVLVLAGFGVWFVLEEGFFLYFVIILTALTLLSLALIALLNYLRNSIGQNKAELPEESFDDLVSPPEDWGPVDQKNFETLREEIKDQLSNSTEWAELQVKALDIVARTATMYNKSEWAFSIPELLFLIEKVSKKYRNFLLDHVPGVEHMKCSWIELGIKNKAKLSNLGRASKYILDSYRLIRLTTPVGILSEIRSQIVSQLFSSGSAALQRRLKQAFLEDVAIVAINLYSGRFQMDGSELSISKTALEDEHKKAAEIEPLRVVMVGQVNAGKSTIINALMEDTVAETSVMPVTNGICIYSCTIDGMEVMKLVDMPGLDGDKNKITLLLDEVTRAHVVIWVLKANQSAREMDVEFNRMINDWYQQPPHMNFKRPPTIMVLNQVDLLKPLSNWNPPYDLGLNSCEKSKTIRDALAFNKELFQKDRIIPLSVSSDKAQYNLDLLKMELQSVFNEGINTQLNQRRQQGKSVNLLNHVNRITNSAKGLFRVMKGD